MATRGSKIPTTVGAEIKAILVERFGKLAAAARAADMPEGTLRRWVFEHPTRLDADTITRFAKVGVSDKLLRRALEDGRKWHQSRV